MSEQEIFNYVISAIFAIVGWYLRTVWQQLKELRDQDAKDAEESRGQNAIIIQEVAQIKILVAGEYVKKQEMNEIAAALFKKLDRIEDKLDKKADKVP